MTDSFDFRFDRSNYERPTNKFVCGRATEWNTPCRGGPTVDGKCGGVSECAPFNNKGRWQCRRPAAAGGACDAGPEPDGTCGCSIPPCVPRRTQRQHRWRLSIAALGLVIAILATFTHLSNDNEIFAETLRIGALDAGPLTADHAGFTGSQGCKTCHSNHDAGPVKWLSAIFVKHDMTGECVQCHTFGGPSQTPHNAIFEPTKKVKKTECVMCHSEHQGEDADISGLKDEQCATCHEKSFTSFDKGHPRFTKMFPHFRRTSVKFDHATHLGRHFINKLVADKAPASCVSCHQATSDQRTVEPVGFDQACASCHVDQISKRNLIVLRLPEFDESSLDKEEVAEVCGPPTEEADEDEEYESVSGDEMSAVAAYLMGVAADDQDEYSEAFQELVMGMADDGTESLGEMVKGSGAGVNAGQLFAGLNPEAARQLACAWASNEEYELPSDAAFGGWYGDLLELMYRPSGHADPVIKAWIEFAVNANGSDDAAKDRAEQLRDTLLSAKNGPGACIKCHAVSRENEGGPLHIEWKYHKDKAQSYRTYSHTRHLSLVNPQGVKLADPNQGCATCHKLNPKAEFKASFNDLDPHTFASNFNSMKKETCVQCHTESRVRQDCQLCHNYHKEPGFTERVTRNEK